MRTKITSLCFMVLIGVMLIPAVSVSANSCEEHQWEVGIRWDNPHGNGRDTIRVWAINGSQAERRALQRWRDQKPQRREATLTIIRTVRL
jgi:hypothetical protein